MKKILMSVAVIGFVGAIAAGATGAFFSDTETSTGNKFTAGSLDLKIDSVQHYNGNICALNEAGAWVWTGNAPYPVPGTACDGSWAEADLGAHKFWHFDDLKPGDWGENTISLHVYDNDAWGKMHMKLYNNVDNDCTEPEMGVEGTDCALTGELLQSMKFETWLDQGGIPGFQCGALDTPGTARCPKDPWEGDNIWQRWDGPFDAFRYHEWQWLNTDVLPMPEPMIQTKMVAMDLQGNKLPLLPSGDPDFDRASFFDVFFEVELAMKGLVTGTTAGVAPVCTPNDGHNNYERCHGIAFDGRLVGSTTYYIGWKWMLPEEVGNEVQSDSLKGDMMFEVEQHRNNPTPWAS